MSKSHLFMAFIIQPMYSYFLTAKKILRFELEITKGKALLFVDIHNY